jgi:hypothetical protein
MGELNDRDAEEEGTSVLTPFLTTGLLICGSPMPESWARRLMGWSYRAVGRSQLLSNTFFARPRSICGPISFSYA